LPPVGPFVLVCTVIKRLEERLFSFFFFKSYVQSDNNNNNNERRSSCYKVIELFSTKYMKKDDKPREE